MCFVILVLFEPVFRPSITAVVPQGPSHNVGCKLQKFIFSLNKFHIPASCSHPFRVSSQFRTDLHTHRFLMFLTSVRKHFQDFQITYFTYSVFVYAFASCVMRSKSLEPSSGILAWKYCSFFWLFLNVYVQYMCDWCLLWIFDDKTA